MAITWGMKFPLAGCRFESSELTWIPVNHTHLAVLLRFWFLWSAKSRAKCEREPSFHSGFESNGCSQVLRLSLSTSWFVFTGLPVTLRASLKTGDSTGRRGWRNGISKIPAQAQARPFQKPRLILNKMQTSLISRGFHVSFPCRFFFQVGIVKKHEASGWLGFLAPANIMHTPGTFCFNFRSILTAQHDGTVGFDLVRINMR